MKLPNRSDHRGLMTDKYLEFVKETACRLGKVFFLDSGEGNDWGDPEGEWYVERLSGWLVDEADADAFKQLLEKGGEPAAWSSPYTYCFVMWEPLESHLLGQSPVRISFEPVENYSDDPN